MRSKKGTILILGGLLLLAAALFWVGYNIWDNIRAERQNQEVTAQLQSALVEADPPAIVIPDTELPKYVLDPNIPMPLKKINGKNYVALLEIPKLKLELSVLNELNYPNLKIAPCRHMGSIYLNNMVIAAHNYASHFGKLASLSAGDAVVLTDMEGNVFHYNVVEIETLKPTAVEEMTESAYPLTLFTCTVSGQARVTVRCSRVD